MNDSLSASAFHKFRPHPWHGISPGKKPPLSLNAYIEITPFDGVKYEIDKKTGYLKVDRPQLTSSLPPALYGFVPQTYCSKRVQALSSRATAGDLDPLDICVLSERPIQRSEVIVPVRPIGGIRLLDRGEADDKIIAVLENDPFWSSTNDIADLNPMIRQRIEHYFLTYKLIPGAAPVTEIEKVYGVDEVRVVIEAALEDYREAFHG